MERRFIEKSDEKSNMPEDKFTLQENMDVMSASELAEAMEDALDAMTLETYDGELIDAYLDEIDKKTSMPEIPDEEEAYEKLVRRLDSLSVTSEYNGGSRRKTVRVHRAWRLAFVALLCVLISMVVVQAAGVDILGALAQWTDEVFSFGTIREDNEVNEISSISDLEETESNTDTSEENEFNSLQSVLDRYGITEIVEPSELPDDYVVDAIHYDIDENGGLRFVCADYTNGTDFFFAQAVQYEGEPAGQYERVNTSIELIDLDNIQAYGIQNIDSYTVTWVIPHYECSVSGKVDKDILIETAKNMIQ